MYQVYGQEDTMSVKITKRDLAKMKITLSKDACFDLRLDSFRLQNKLSEKYGEAPAILDEAEKAIRISIDESMGTKYIIDSDEGGINIVGGHYVAIHEAIKALISRFGDDCVFDGNTISGKADVQIEWENDGSAQKLLSGEMGEKTKYRLVWNDEFDGEKIDYEKWSGCANMGLENVTLSFDDDAVHLEDGKLIMTADVIDKENRKYLSNYSVSTHDTMNYSGGYLEMRARVPMRGMGEWPSYWAISTDSEIFLKKYMSEHDGNVPPTGYSVEVDMFEVFSSKDTIIPNLHKMFYLGYHCMGISTGKYFDKNGSPMPDRVQLSGIDAGASVSGTRGYIFEATENMTATENANDWHNYGFLWNKDLMAFSVDGVFYYAYSMKDQGKDDSFNPTYYDKDGNPRRFGMDGFEYQNMALSLILNNMLFPEGCIFPWAQKLDKKNDDVLFPLKYEVEYMRLYQTEGDKIYTPSVIGNGKKYFSVTYFG